MMNLFFTILAFLTILEPHSKIHFLINSQAGS